MPAYKENPICKGCGAEKSRDEYYQRKSGCAGYFVQPCKECQRAKMREHYHDNKSDPEYYRKKQDRIFKRRYGISLQDKLDIITKQDYQCVICGKCDDRGLVMDHDHDTGRIRQALCNRCNVGVGVIESNLYEDFLKYVEKHKEVEIHCGS
jgi:ribosomal protein S6E (S10)